MLVGAVVGRRHAGPGGGRVPVGLTWVRGVESARLSVPLVGSASIGTGVSRLLACDGLFPFGAGPPLGCLGLAALGAGGAYLGLFPVLAGQLAAPSQLTPTDQRDSQAQQRNYDDRANHDPGNRSGIQRNTSSVSKQSCPWERCQNAVGDEWPAAPES